MEKEEFYNIVKSTCEETGKYEHKEFPKMNICKTNVVKPWCIEHLGVLNTGCEYYDNLEDALYDFVSLVYG